MDCAHPAHLAETRICPGARGSGAGAAETAYAGPSGEGAPAPGTTGDSLASFLLGLPNSYSRRDTDETEHGGWEDGFYFTDQWKATPKLTANLGTPL